MRNPLKILFTIIVSAIIMLSLAGCADSFKKPTGLEDKDGIELTHSTDDQIASKDSQEDEQTDRNKPNNASTVKKQDEKSNQTSSSKDKTVSKGKSDSGESSSKEKTDTKGKSKDITSSSPSSNKQNKEKTKEKKSDTKKSPSTNKTKDKEKKSDKEKKEDPEPAKQKTSTMVYSIVISDNEVPLPPTEMAVLDEGDTVLEALIRITRERKIQMDYRGGRGATAYVEGIDNVYEFDRGQGSGWMYRINGVFPDRGAGVVPVCPGDRVEWIYTTDLGKDIGADLAPVRRDGKCPTP